MSRTLAGNALTTVATVKDGFSTAASDDEIIRLINSRSSRFEQRTGRFFGYAVVGSGSPEYVKGGAQFEIFLKRRPIRDISSIKLGGWVYGRGWVGLPIYDYVDQRTSERDLAGSVFRQVGWPMVVPEWDDLTRDPDTRRMGRLEDIQVCYTGGWILPQYHLVTDSLHNPDGLPSDLPAEIEDGCIRTIRHSIRSPYGGLVEERTAGGWSQKYSDRVSNQRKEFDDETEAMLEAQSMSGAFFL